MVSQSPSSFLFRKESESDLVYLTNVCTIKTIPIHGPSMGDYTSIFSKVMYMLYIYMYMYTGIYIYKDAVLTFELDLLLASCQHVLQ